MCDAIFNALSPLPSIPAFLWNYVLPQIDFQAPSRSGSGDDATRNAHNIKAALYFLGADAVRISRSPECASYSHDAVGEPLPAYHPNAIPVTADQGHEPMEGAPGDAFTACTPPMPAHPR